MSSHTSKSQHYDIKTQHLFSIRMNMPWREKPESIIFDNFMYTREE